MAILMVICVVAGFLLGGHMMHGRHDRDTDTEHVAGQAIPEPGDDAGGQSTNHADGGEGNPPHAR